MTTTDDTLAVRRTGRYGIVDADTFTMPGLSPNARLVYVALTLYAGRTGEAWPSPGTLAEQVGIHRATVYRALDELEAAGVINRRRRTTTNGADRPTLVTILDPGRGSVADSDTRVADSDTRVAQGDTRSVAQGDTNMNQENKTRARDSRAPAPTPTGGRAVAGTDETRAMVADTYRRRGLDIDHTAGADKARAALAAALTRERYG